jgi:glycosyltransferase involved in cell wall biosynthesis
MRQRVHSRVAQQARELSLDAERPWRWLETVSRLVLRLRRLRPRALVVSDGGYPLCDLSWRMICAARLAGVSKIILAVHNYPVRGTNSYRRMALNVLRWLPPRMTELVTNSQHLGRALQQETGMAQAPVCIHYGIHPVPEANDRAALLQALDLPEGKPIIGAVANVERRKGLNHLIMAMKRVTAQLPEARAVLIGLPFDAEHDRELHALIAQLGLQDRVFMKGYLKDAAKYIECFDVVAVPSLQDNFPLVTLEAMKRRKPLIAAVAGGLPEAVEDGDNGLLVPAADADALADALLRLLRSPELRQQMGERGHQRFLEKYTVKKMAENYYRLSIGIKEA